MKSGEDVGFLLCLFNQPICSNEFQRVSQLHHDVSGNIGERKILRRVDRRISTTCLGKNRQYQFGQKQRMVSPEKMLIAHVTM